jgi:hypothetical protein
MGNGLSFEKQAENQVEIGCFGKIRRILCHGL